MNEDTGVDTQQEVQETSAPSPVEQKALDMGWRPKEEFDGDDEHFIDAKEFVARQPLFDRIAQQNKQIKATRDALEAFKGHYTKVRETEYKRALTDLKAEQKKALVEGDVDKFYAIEEQRDSIEAEKAEFVREQESIQSEAPQLHPTLAQWAQRNPWYETQPHMRVYAEEIGDRYAPAVRAGKMTGEQVLAEIEKAVRAEFPTKFRNPNKDKPSAVEGSSRQGRASVSKDPELNDMERSIMKTLVDGGHITKEKYLADLKQAKGL